MFNIFTVECSRYNDFAEGFGAVWEGYGDNSAQTLAGPNNADVMKDTQISKIPGHSFQTLSGIFNQHTNMSLRFMPITIELSLVDDHLEHCVSNLGIYAC